MPVSATERMLAERLERRGWRVNLHVGRGKDYRVSLALARPEAPQTWVLGVELDGTFQRSAPTVLDREVVRPGVLERLGWSILQVSVLDALLDVDAVSDRIHAAATAAVETT